MSEAEFAEAFRDVTGEMYEPKQGMSAFYKSGVDQTTDSEPEQRALADVLISMQMTLEEILAVQRHMLARIAQSTDSRSSVEVKTSTRGVDIAAKSYADSDVSAQVLPAVLAYFDAMAEVQKRVNGSAS